MEELWVKLTAELIVDLNGDGVPETNFPTQYLEGPAVLQWSDPADSDDDTLTDVETEIVSMDLVPSLHMYLKEDPNRTSEGLIEAQSMTAVFPADSFFDVFFVGGIPGTGSVRNQVPARLTATVQAVPPYSATYVADEDILLYDDLGEHRGTLTSLTLAVYGP